MPRKGVSETFLVVLLEEPQLSTFLLPYSPSEPLSPSHQTRRMEMPPRLAKSLAIPLPLLHTELP